MMVIDQSKVKSFLQVNAAVFALYMWLNGVCDHIRGVCKLLCNPQLLPPQNTFGAS